VLEDDELKDAVDRFGLKNVGYEIYKAFRSNMKRLRMLEEAKRKKRELLNNQ
jgi:hypothetical protein